MQGPIRQKEKEKSKQRKQKYQFPMCHSTISVLMKTVLRVALNLLGTNGQMKSASSCGRMWRNFRMNYIMVRII